MYLVDSCVFQDTACLSLAEILTAADAMAAADRREFLYSVVFAIVSNDNRFTAANREKGINCRDEDLGIDSISSLKDLKAEEIKQLGSFMSAANRNKLVGLVDAVLAPPTHHTQVRHTIIVDDIYVMLLLLLL